MRKDIGFLLLNQIMGANFKMKDLINYVRSKESSTTFLHQELHSRMECERKNRSLEELDRTLLNATDFPKYLWADAVSTTCYVLNKVLIRPILKKTPYEPFKGRKPNISH